MAERDSHGRFRLPRGAWATSTPSRHDGARVPGRHTYMKHSSSRRAAQGLLPANTA
jgi:hypothetical protein